MSDEKENKNIIDIDKKGYSTPPPEPPPKIQEPSENDN